MFAVKKFALCAAVAAVAASLPAVAAPFDVIGLGFEGVLASPGIGTYPEATVGAYYAKGLSGSGVLGAEDLGITFSGAGFAIESTLIGGLGQWGANRWATLADIAGGASTAVQGVGSAAMTFIDVVAYEKSQNGNFTPQGLVSVDLNVAGGFNNGLSFYYNTGAVGTVTALDINGNAIGSVSLGISNSCPVDAGVNCIWTLGSVALTQTAYGIRFAGVGFSTSFDNLTFGSLTPIDGAFNPTPIPEPGTYALMALGLAAVGVAARRRQR